MFSFYARRQTQTFYTTATRKYVLNLVTNTHARIVIKQKKNIQIFCLCHELHTITTTTSATELGLLFFAYVFAQCQFELKVFTGPTANVTIVINEDTEKATQHINLLRIKPKHRTGQISANSVSLTRVLKAFTWRAANGNVYLYWIFLVSARY